MSRHSIRVLHYIALQRVDWEVTRRGTRSGMTMMMAQNTLFQTFFWSAVPFVIFQWLRVTPRNASMKRVVRELENLWYVYSMRKRKLDIRSTEANDVSWDV
jgi:hypothetical protein